MPVDVEGVSGHPCVTPLKMLSESRAWEEYTYENVRAKQDRKYRSKNGRRRTVTTGPMAGDCVAGGKTAVTVAQRWDDSTGSIGEESLQVT